MIKISQYDPRWSKVKMTPSNLTLGRYGCTTTAICMLSDYYRCFKYPDEAIDTNIKYTQDGLIIWSLINFPKFKFAERVHGHHLAKIRESLKNPKTSVILAINNNSHWVTACRVLGNYYLVVDPWGGKYRWIHRNIVSGSAHFLAK